MAKAMVRKYGNRKDHLNIDDCYKINERRVARGNSKGKGSPNRPKAWGDT